MAGEETAQSTARFNIPYSGRNQQNSYETYKSGFETIGSLFFSTMETSKFLLKLRPFVSIEYDGSDWEFKQGGDAQFVSRTYQSTIVVSQGDLILQPDSIIGITFQSGATSQQTVAWTLYQSNIPIDFEVLSLGYVNSDYTITWFNGSLLGLSVSAPLFSGSNSKGVTVSSSPYSIVSSDETLFVTGTATGVVSITLTSAETYAGRRLRIIDAAFNCSMYNITVVTEGSAKIHGEDDMVMRVDGMSIDLESNGTDFFAV